MSSPVQHTVQHHVYARYSKPTIFQASSSNKPPLTPVSTTASAATQFVPPKPPTNFVREHTKRTREDDSTEKALAGSASSGTSDNIISKRVRVNATSSATESATADLAQSVLPPQNRASEFEEKEKVSTQPPRQPIVAALSMAASAPPPTSSQSIVTTTAAASLSTTTTDISSSSATAASSSSSATTVTSSSTATAATAHATNVLNAEEIRQINEKYDQTMLLVKEADKIEIRDNKQAMKLRTEAIVRLSSVITPSIVLDTTNYEIYLPFFIARAEEFRKIENKFGEIDDKKKINQLPKSILVKYALKCIQENKFEIAIELVSKINFYSYGDPKDCYDSYTRTAFALILYAFNQLYLQNINGNYGMNFYIQHINKLNIPFDANFINPLSFQLSEIAMNKFSSVFIQPSVKTGYAHLIIALDRFNHFPEGSGLPPPFCFMYTHALAYFELKIYDKTHELLDLFLTEQAKHPNHPHGQDLLDCVNHLKRVTPKGK